MKFTTFLKKLKKSNSGIAILELLIASSIMSIIALGTSELIKQQFNTMKMIDSKFDANNVADDLDEIVSNNQLCSKNFIGKRLNDNLSNLLDNEDRILYQVGQKKRGLNVREIKIKKFEDEGENKLVTVQVSMNKSSHRHSKMIKKLIRFRAKLNNNNQIDSCHSLNKNNDIALNSICEKFGGKLNADNHCTFTGGQLQSHLNQVLEKQMDYAEQIAKIHEELEALRSAQFVILQRNKCEILGGTWNQQGRTCSVSPRSEICTRLGGQWNEESGRFKCSRTRKTLCESFGGIYNDDNRRCTHPNRDIANI